MKDIFKIPIPLWEKNKKLPSQEEILERFKKFYSGEQIILQEEEFLSKPLLETEPMIRKEEKKEEEKIPSAKKTKEMRRKNKK